MSQFVLSLYLLAYALLHSLLASHPFKAAVARRWPDSARWYRFAYGVIAVLTLLPLPALLWWLPDRALYAVPTPWNGLMLAGQVLALLGFIGALRQTDVQSFLGIRRLRGEIAPERLVTDGYYRYVRHPLYSFGLAMLWLAPLMTLNGLTVYALVSLYLLVGSIHEEHRLEQEFGTAYQAYRARTGRFLPRLPKSDG